MLVREAVIDDSEMLAHIQIDSYRASYANIFPPTYFAHFTYEEQTGDWRDLIANLNHDLLYVAENERGDIIGYAIGRPGKTTIPPYDCELVALHVRQSEQRRRAGRQLMSAIADACNASGCASLLLWVLAENHPARAFYERLGGQQVGEQTVSITETFTAQEIVYGWPTITDLVISG